MASTGSHLRELRERHSVALDELARTTRIGQRFLEALEADDFSALPAGPFAKGFIRSYCQALNEPAGEALDLYTAAISSSAPSIEIAAPPPRERRSVAPVFVSLALLVLLGGALAAVTLALRSGRGDAPREVKPTAEARASRPSERAPARAPEHVVPPSHPVAPIAPTSPPSPPAAPAPTRAAEAPAAAAAPPPSERRVPSPAGATTPYRLVARASDPTWIRVRMEGGRTIEETIPAGEIREWVSNRPFELRIGNAGGVSLELNGRALPPLGARGAVVERLVLPAEPQ